MDSNLCGTVQSFVYSAFVDDVAITPSDDIQVSIPDLELFVAKETWDLAGDYVIKVEAQLQDYAVIATAEVETNLKILTSCL